MKYKDRLSILREVYGSNRKIAKSIGVSHTTVNRWFKNKGVSKKNKEKIDRRIYYYDKRYHVWSEYKVRFVKTDLQTGKVVDKDQYIVKSKISSSLMRYEKDKKEDIAEINDEYDTDDGYHISIKVVHVTTHIKRFKKGKQSKLRRF